MEFEWALEFSQLGTGMGSGMGSGWALIGNWKRGGRHHLPQLSLACASRLRREHTALGNMVF